ncbi:MAG TPA: class I SAM-dependent methyltransferase [Cyclobacteriaceae bacterium]|mgnify:CR=1 FL=1|nr:class I SAM-dependent methyltransferase [Cyclobacteriaceae bacterium]HPW61787.1 class I SAM-dependent methyltransferase [Cyclobacteriaceae bacterium]HRG80150.1 class I SAM-dependent methyltransferase [Cyclobacteriaceae bacterium]
MNNRTSYNRIAKQWTDIRKNSFVSRLVVDFADKVMPNGHILDIGCGSGLPLTKYLSQRGFRVTGIDAAQEMIAIAKSSSIERADFIISDFLDFITKDKFDAIIAWDSLWHFPKTKQNSLYPKIASMLRANGYFLFTHGNVDGEHIDTMMGEPFYYSAISQQDIYRQLTKNGFEIDYAFNDFIENNSHRACVVLAKKL